MMERKAFASRAAVFFGLSVLFFLPAIEKLWSLAAAGVLRRVDVALVLAGGFGAGALFATGMSAWRSRHRAAG